MGGVGSVLNGGKFGHGFFSAGLTKGLDVNNMLPGISDGMNSARVITAAIIGGTISALTGGKFANGAVTAGLGQAVNGNSYWDKVKQLGEIAITFLPGYDLVGCIKNGCSAFSWSLAVGEVAMWAAGAGGVRALYKFVKRWKAARAAKGVKVHKNSLDYVGDTHVYRIKGPDGSTYKIGESAQGTRVRDGASIRAEQQARRLTRETGDTYTTEIRKTFPDKASARAYETRLIERFRRMYGDDTLPGNKTNR